VVLFRNQEFSIESSQPKLNAGRSFEELGFEELGFEELERLFSY
jgi:hypothetical protein